MYYTYHNTIQENNGFLLILSKICRQYSKSVSQIQIRIMFGKFKGNTVTLQTSNSLKMWVHVISNPCDMSLHSIFGIHLLYDVENRSNDELCPNTQLIIARSQI